MFIRTKSRKSKDGTTLKYAYLVNNKYRKKGPKQKVRKYLGKVIELEKTQNNTFSNEDIPLKKSILELLKLELLNHSFSEETSTIYKKDDVIVDLAKKVVLKSNKSIYLAFNDGYLGTYTLTKILNYKPPEALDKEVGKDLAKKLISVGILLNSETFLNLFNKLKQDIKK